MDNLNPYSDYQDSGLPWLGEIPLNWEVRRNGRLFQQRNETGFPELPILEVSLRTGVRVRDFDNSNRKQVMSDRDKYKRSRRGDIAFNMMRMWQGAVGVAPEDGLISPAYIVAKPLPETNARYYEYLFRTGSYMDEVNKFSRGIVSDRNRLYWEDFKQMPSPFPPLEEQSAIVRFLDHADRRIRRYIRAKRKLIELLNEQKQALIHQAVTRGLDPNVPLKPSGVEWLGDVPEHCQVVALRYLATKFGSGITPRGGATVYQSHGVPFLRSQNIHFDGLRLDGVARISDSLHGSLTTSHVRPNDVLLNITGASIGRACTVPEDFTEANVNQHVCIIRPRLKRVLPEYLAAYIATPMVQREIRVSQNGASREGLTLQDIRGMKVVLPILEEQEKLIGRLHEESATIRDCIKQAVIEIELIQEYRTRLIADVVTGKLEVREAAARLDERVTQEPSKNRPTKQPNKHFYRSVLAAEIVDCHQGNKRFGRIKLQKALVLAEYQLQLTEIQSDLKRAAAGPFDNTMMRSIDAQLKRQKWFEVYKSEDAGFLYKPLEKRGEHRTYFNRYWSDKQADFDRLVALIKPMRTIQAEIVATLYSAWNDFLIDGEQFDDERLVAEVLTNWHPKKERITEERWHKAIQWMRDNQLVPTGFGAHTKQQATNKGQK